MKDKFSIFIAIIIVLVLLATGFFAVKKTVAKIHQPAKGILIVGTNPPFPPFETMAGDEVVGFDMDLTDKIAQKLKRRVIVKTFTEFDALLPTLLRKELDLVASSVTITPERKELFDFSLPYYTAAQAVLAKKNNQTNVLNKPEDFAGRRVGYQKGTTSQSWIENNLLGKVKVGDCTSFQDLNYGLQLLKFGALDAIILDKPAADGIAKSNPGLAVVGVIETGEQYGLAVPKGDPQHLLPTVNAVIKEMQEKGDYQKLIEKWFGGEK